MDKDELQKIFTEDQYQVQLFTEKGYERRQCVSCSHYYWSIDPDRTTCGDTPCEGGYHFIGKKTADLDFHKTLARITEFFEKNGHTAIEPYPTVARWRDDLDFTIASIADFQPWVTNGTLPPPANPLVVPQPCIRFGGEFSDVDNVGRTGRHLTSFIMFGQHAFNGPDLKGGYWMDRCIDLNFEFLTDVLQIKPIDLTYIEGIWMGGGNFGPNLESFAFGTELVNSVFMQYENTPTGYREMDLKVIDVGWGLERLSWFSQGTPTIYEAVLGPVHDYILKETGINYDKELVSNYAKVAGLIDVNEVKDLKSARSSIANDLGLSLSELNSSLQEIEAIYAIGDHARTLAFTLADGAIPSNVGGGYNLRTILRRIFTLNDMLDFNLDVTEIISRSALYLSQSFPRVRESEKFAGTIVDIERGRHLTTLDKGRKYVQNMLKQGKSLETDTLIELYTSRGIPPETVEQLGSEIGIEIEVPLDFYQQVDKVLPKIEKAKEGEEELDLNDLKSFQTEQLYYDKKLKSTSKANIEAILDTGHVILDKTIFYPTGGGQAEDLGWISLGKTRAEVVDVKKYGTAIVHKLRKVPESFKVGSKVELELDMERRLALMRHHTAVHIVGGAAREVLGSHVWQAGADKTPDRGRLDITHWESISRETLDEIESVSNRVVMDNRKIKKHILERSEAEQKFGFTIYQGGVVPGKDLRIIEIPGIDTEACGGTHADATGEIGYIRIINAERIQDGIVRLTLKAGMNAVDNAQHEYQLLSESAAAFKVTPEELPKTSERFFSEWKDQQKLIDKLSNDLAAARVPQLVADAKEVVTEKGTTVRVIVTELHAPQTELINLGQQFSSLSKDTGDLVSVIVGTHEGRAMVVVAKSEGSQYPLTPIIRSVGKLLGGGGGGKGDVVAGGGTNTSGVPEALKKAESIIIKEI